MNRMNRVWRELRNDRRKALVPFVTCGFPRPQSTVAVVRSFAEAGATFVELGLPFSDPVADGQAIQYSSQVALANGVTVQSVLNTVKQIRKYSDIPLILMGYANPLWQYGWARFTRAAKDSGVDGLLIVDLTLEEAKPVSTLCQKAGLSLVFLISPTTPQQRVKTLDRASSDFSYCLSVTGVTGSRWQLDGDLRGFLARVRQNTKKPFVVGFGLWRAEQVRQIKSLCDGVVIGSVLVDCYRTEKSERQATQKAARLLKGIGKALNTAG